MTEPTVVEQSNVTSMEYTNESSSIGDTDKKKYSIQNVPRLPRELTPLAAFTPLVELDQRGPLFNGSGAQRNTGRYKVRSSDEESVKLAKEYAVKQNAKYIIMKQQQQQQRVQLDVIKKQQALLLMCRIYVGSINFELNEAKLKQEFQSFGPVRSVSLTFDPVTNRHKGFAFLEYETPEAAQLSIEQMNGVVLGGRNIKVGRPSNMPQAQPIIDQLTEEAKSHNRIYVASIHQGLTENDIRSVFEAFGKIKSCTLVKDSNTNKHKGYGFIEFDTFQASQDAINSMNLFDIGGQHLRVGKALTPPDGFLAASPAIAATVMPTATAVAAAAITATLRAKDLETNSQLIVDTSSIINNPMTQVECSSGPLAPTNMAIALSTAAHSGATIVTSALPSILNPTSTIVNPISQSSTVGSTRIRSNFVTPPISTPIPSPQIIVPPPPSMMIPQPTLLEDLPIPIGLRTEIESQKQSHPSISLTLPTKNSKESTGKPSESLSLSNAEDPTASLSRQEELTVKGREQRHLLMQKLNQRRLESCICVLRNMIGIEDIDADFEQDITEECSKYGHVVKVLIYNEEQTQGECVEHMVKVFVEFQTSNEAERTVKSLNGRHYSGRMIKAEIYDETAYRADDLSG